MKLRTEVVCVKAEGRRSSDQKNHGEENHSPPTVLYTDYKHVTLMNEKMFILNYGNQANHYCSKRNSPKNETHSADKIKLITKSPNLCVRLETLRIFPIVSHEKTRNPVCWSFITFRLPFVCSQLQPICCNWRHKSLISITMQKLSNFLKQTGPQKY